jgi:hypothetical protein
LALLLPSLVFAGTPNLEGTTWKGTYDAIRPNGDTFDDLSIEFDFEKQFGSLFQGVARVEVPGGGTITIAFTLNISQDKRIIGLAQYDIGVALTFEGKWNGKTMTGVAIDPTDGATSVFTVKKDTSS